jgi:3-hydroxyacyl-CoA dehydrogenase
MSARPIATVAVVGTGVIGASWVAKFLAAGLDVVASDPGPDAEAKMHAAIASHWTVLERMGLAHGASTDRVRFVGDPAAAVSGADFVQENGPEVEDLKVDLMAQLDEAAPSDTPIGCWSVIRSIRRTSFHSSKWYRARRPHRQQSTRRWRSTPALASARSG